MASNRLTWQELRKAVVEYTNCSEQEADRFLNALLESVIEGLKQDKQVKIKGLGVFTLKAVAPRKSVNIATGEDIIIDGYNKLTFTAESMLKESVEKRIDQPKTEEMVEELKNDPLKKLNEQASEIVDILSELGQSPDGKEVKVAEDKPKANKKSAETKKPKATKGKKAVKKDEPSKEVEVVESPVSIKEEKKEEKKKRNWKWIWWVLGLIVLAGAVGTGVYYREQIIGWWQCTSIMERPIKKKKYHDIVTSRQGRHHSSRLENGTSNSALDAVRKSVVGWWENVAGKEEVKVEIRKIEVPTKKSDSGVKPVRTLDHSQQDPYGNLSYENTPGIQEYYPNEEEEEIVVPTAAEEAAEAMPIYEEEVEAEEVVALADEPRKYTKFIATEVVDKNSRLTLIAQKYYGSKDLWVFIYEANRNVINDPARVSAGQKLRIPALDDKYMDMSNPELQALVKELIDTYVK